VKKDHTGALLSSGLLQSFREQLPRRFTIDSRWHAPVEWATAASQAGVSLLVVPDAGMRQFDRVAGAVVHTEVVGLRTKRLLMPSATGIGEQLNPLAAAFLRPHTRSSFTVPDRHRSSPAANLPVGFEASAPTEHPSFSVDTHLFRELGELLVGRDSTALVELIKNAYDADARDVTVYGQALDFADQGFITISDTGIGMSREEFERGFLTIASRGKDVGDRRSSFFGRRYTGAKGIGRLAAHKLARIVEITSLRWDGERLARHRLPANEGVIARIDWELVEDYANLDAIRGSNAITVTRVVPPHGAKAGTTITLRKLRGNWSKSARGKFLEEVQTFGPSPALTEKLPRAVVSSRLLFDSPSIRDDPSSRNGGFTVRLEGELAPPDDYWQAKAESASWILEIDASSITGEVRYCIAPTHDTMAANPDAKRGLFTIAHPDIQRGPFFQARIFLRTGKAWERDSGGIRVFSEGFRLLPYGEPRNDWLALDRDASARSWRLNPVNEEHPLYQLLGEGQDDKVGLTGLPNKHYYGGVFFTVKGAGALRTLVNREGFVPDSSYTTLVELVRGGIDLLTRTRAAASERTRSKRRADRAQARSTNTPAFSAALRVGLADAIGSAKEARNLVARGAVQEARTKVDELLRHLEQVEQTSDDAIDEAAMLRVLASVGTQMAAFVHEINGLVGTAEAVDHALRRLGTSQRAPAMKAREQKALLGQLRGVVGDLRRNLERQASYLTDVVTPDARRRRTKQRFAERFDSAARLVATAAQMAGIAIENGIPATLLSPPMFPAEMTTVFSNLLTNAVKASHRGGRIRATGARKPGGISVRIENTGKEVNLDDSERWFEPFESTTTKVDAVLGQGMGLGLPITRSVLAEYGASIRFVPPSTGFSTAVEIVFPH
jgi:signal transduction histidine kinase